MPNYQIEFVGGGAVGRPPIDVVCAGDQEALDWAGWWRSWRTISVLRFPMMEDRSDG